MSGVSVETKTNYHYSKNTEIIARQHLMNLLINITAKY